MCTVNWSYSNLLKTKQNKTKNSFMLPGEAKACPVTYWELCYFYLNIFTGMPEKNLLRHWLQCWKASIHQSSVDENNLTSSGERH